MLTMRRSNGGLPMWKDAYSSLLVALLAVASPAWTAEPMAEPQQQEPAAGGEASGNDATRALGGTSVIGNRELPKSLYIVPWKNSEVGVRTDLSRDLLDEGLTPVDPNEFERQVQFYEYHQQQR